MGEALCYKTGNGALAYKKDGEYAGCLIYKSFYSNVYISWGEDHKDLDICAYWLGWPEGKVGWSHGTKRSSDHWRLIWYGDNRETGGSEKLLPRIVPWNKDCNHVLRVHFNWYPKSEKGKGGTCSVRVTSSDGKATITKSGVACGQRGGKATTDDPYVDITYDSSGNAISIVQ